MLRICLLSLSIFGLLIPSHLSAAEKKERVAHTEAPKGDADYPFQGEYLGSWNNEACRCEPIGIQVVARGDAAFQAVLYRCGLPGYGWPIDGERLKFEGTREADKVTLTGESFQLEIQNGNTIIKAIGDYDRTLGRADKVTRRSPTIGACPPCGATVLFGGSSTDLLKGARVTDDGLLQEGFETKDAYGDFRLHAEFRLPYMPNSTGQARGNSGFYLQSRYEVQVLDSFGLDGVANECGGLYRQRKPDLNMCLPPLVWQTYDIWLRSARFGSDGKRTAKARITVWHNGVAIHDDVEIENKTGAGKQEGTQSLPTKFQNHRDPVRFRNIWLVSHDCPSASESRQQLVRRPKRDSELTALLRTIGFRR